MRIQVLGTVRAWLGDEPVELTSAGQRAVLGLLALAGGQPVTRSELIDALWGDDPPASAVNVLQTYVKHLRRRLEPDRPARSRSALLPHVGDGYALRATADTLDLLCFRQLSAQATAARQEGDDRRAATLLDRALRQWQGAPLADVPQLAGHPKVVAVAAERGAALARYGELKIALGEVAEALPALAEAVAAQPLDEAGQARLIRAYAAAGRRADAFEAYHAARRRLADELGVDPGPELRAAHDIALRDEAPPATATRTAVPAQLPADVPDFIGRDGELARLDALLGSPTVVISALSGTAGVGKTALAVRWAHRVRTGFPDGQLYINLRGYDAERPVPAGEALARFLRALGVPGQEVPLDAEERADRYRSLLDGRRMLIVLDNAASVAQVRPLLPGTPGCLTVVTSRDALPGLVARHGARRLDLDLLPHADAIALLRRLIGRRCDEDPDAADELAERCARLPLALRVAAELALARPSVPLRQLVGELADERRRLTLLDAGGDPETGVRAVFSFSYRQLPAPAARAFRLLGLHPGPDVEPYAAAALFGTPVTEAHDLLEALAGAHLLQRGTPGRYGLHDLLRAYASELALLDGDETGTTRLLDAWLHTARAAMTTLHPAERGRHGGEPAGPRPVPIAPVGDPAAAQAWLDAERGNLAAAVAFAAAHDLPGHAVALTVTLLRYLEGGGHVAEAVAMHAHARDAARLTGDVAAEAQLLNNVALIYSQQGRFPQAAEYLRAAIDAARRCGDLAAETRALGNLGHVDAWLGRYDDAAARLREALELCRRTGDRAAEARVLGNLGQIYRRQGRHADAEAHLRRSVALCRDVSDHIGEAYALVSLGHVEAGRGLLADAADHHRAALALFRRSTERGGEALALDGLGSAELALGGAEGFDRLLQSLAIFRRLGERAGEAQAGNSIGEAHAAAGRHGAAREAHAAALAVAREIGDRYEQARAHSGLVAAAEALSDQATAEIHRRAALAIYAEIGAPQPASIFG
ncbi:BTAD domain-containing putative transcriptional regulator [Catenuloplanes atrovinosus]|uniref:DNA-binding SARP family transcriptional activator n=1 Tax=Catenuloplanes atrovinosus TaxID=137266 RepID=A0AAE3YN36_9ACTN|nr:BTAD domain-containing putative transcriptional regulator [Catenuloplanes atrovinosus]MDR7274836.1 DNA-binding SARP family transcriptional activator [Catenuloplanes atrovinosus]